MWCSRQTGQNVCQTDLMGPWMETQPNPRFDSTLNHLFVVEALHESRQMLTNWLWYLKQQTLGDNWRSNCISTHHDWLIIGNDSLSLLTATVIDNLVCACIIVHHGCYVSWDSALCDTETQSPGPVGVVQNSKQISLFIHQDLILNACMFSKHSQAHGINMNSSFFLIASVSLLYNLQCIMIAHMIVAKFSCLGVCTCAILYHAQDIFL